jgi:hypothetical protein
MFWTVYLIQQALSAGAVARDPAGNAVGHQGYGDQLAYNEDLAEQLRSDPLNLKMGERSNKEQINEGVLEIYNTARQSGVETRFDCYVEMLDKFITETEDQMLLFNSIVALAAIGTQAAHEALMARLVEAPCERLQDQFSSEYLKQLMIADNIAHAAAMLPTKSRPLLDSLIKAWTNWKGDELLSNQISEAIVEVTSADRKRFQDLDGSRNEIGIVGNII